MDILTDVLRSLRLRGTVYFQADFRAPWGMDIKGGEFANFHLVLQGRCWVRPRGRDAPIALGGGDLAIFPHGSPHALLHDPDGVAQPVEALIPEQEEMDGEDEGMGTPKVYGGQGLATTLICGHFEFDREALHPMLASLPELIHIRREDHAEPEWMATATSLALAESGTARAGGEAVVDRLAEVLLVQALRAYIESLEGGEGFLAALADPALSSALSLLHDDPARPWSLPVLARNIGVSRSVLAARFKEAVGTSPMLYLTRWRMQKARELLLTTERPIPEIAERVGYQSEWAFAKAFKRIYGSGPGAVRRLRRNTG